MKVAVTREGKIVGIREAQNGKSCACRCLECSEPVVARQGNVRDWHYAHEAGKPPCTVNPETLLHRFVKQVIAEERSIRVPELPEPLRQLHRLVADHAASGWLNFDRTFEEVWLDGRRPDVVGLCGEARVLIEVAYSNLCSAEKIKELNGRGWLAIEIEVARFAGNEFDPSAVRHWLLADLADRRWLTPTVPEPAESESGDAPCVQSVPVADQAERVAESPARPVLILNIVLSGRWVSLKRLPFGDIALSCEYGDDAVKQIKYVAKRFRGQYKRAYTNWLIPGCFEGDVVAMLHAMQDGRITWR